MLSISQTNSSFNISNLLFLLHFSVSMFPIHFSAFLCFVVNVEEYCEALKSVGALAWNGFAAGNYMFKVNNRNTRIRYEICSNGVVLMSLLLTLSIFHTLFCFCC